MPEFGKSVFICSKPLQLLNCCSIMREYDLHDTEVHLVTSSIHDHENFITFIKKTNHFKNIKKITPHKNHFESVKAIKLLDYDSLFIESDRVSLYNLLAPLKKKYLSVFEEGIGTYINDYSNNFTGLKKLKWKMLSLITGCGLRFGDGRKTNFVFVQYPKLYKSLNPKSAKKALYFPGILDEIEQDLDAWEDLINNEIGLLKFKSTSANLILGSWGGFANEHIEKIKNKNINNFYKAHPHDGVEISNIDIEKIKISWLPAEACIGVLQKKYSKLEVYHLSSSVSLYCNQKYNNVFFHDLRKNQLLTEIFEKELL